MLTWIFVLLVGGAVMLFVEFFIPGLVVGTLGAIALILSCALAVREYPEYAAFIIPGYVAGVIAILIAGVSLFPKTPIARFMILKDEQRPEEGWVNDTGDPALVGATGEVYTALRPAGSIVVNGKRVDAVADGAFIDKGARVKIIEVRGNRVVVEQATE